MMGNVDSNIIQVNNAGERFQKVWAAMIDEDNSTINSTNQFPTTPYANCKSDFFLEVSKGNITGYSSLFWGGINTTVPNTYESVVPWSDTYVFPTSASSLAVSSTSTNDNSAGTGARQIAVNGLDENYAELTEVLTTDGTSTVMTTNDFLRVNTANVISSGTLNVNEGDIDIVHGTDILARIVAEDGQTNQTNYTVPAGKTFVFFAFAPSCSKADEVEVGSEIYLVDTGTKYHLSKIYMFEENFFGDQQFQPIVPEKTDYIAKAKKIGTGTAKVSVFLEAAVIDNTEL